MNKRLSKLFSFVTILALMLVAVPMQSAQALSADIVISQVYGGGGNAGATYTHDFIELFNRGTFSVSLAGWSVQYASATGTGNFGSSSTQLTELPSVSLAPGQYLLIQEAQGSGGTTALPTPDVTDSSPIPMSGTGGKVALVMSTASLGCNGGSTPCSPAQLALIKDLVGWDGANFYETAAAPATANATASLRLADGCTETDNNSLDFVTSTPTPRNTVSPLNLCDGGGSNTNILINEVDSDTPGIDAAEFIELYDGGTGNTALDGMVVVLFNGNGDTSYDAFDLDGYITDANGYFVIGSVPENDIYVNPGSSGWLQNGADAVALYTANASDFPNGTAVSTTNLIDAFVYDTNDADDAGLLDLLNSGQPQVDENGGGDGAGQSNQRCPNGSGGTRNTETYAQFAPTPGDANTCVTPVTLVKIHDVQGNGAASPLVGQTVAIEGIVVGDFQDGASGTNGDFNGFHVEEEDADADADPLTSEGVFVFDGNSPAVNVQIGDLVRVEGVVSEFNDLTEITSFTGVTVLSSGNPLPTAATLSLPVTNVNDFEAYEGMLVTFPQALVISEYFNFDRFGEIVLTSERHLTPTAEFEPGSPQEIQATQDFLLDKITLDDGRSTQNPDPAIHPNGNVFDLTNLFRGGDTVSNVTGVIDYSFGLYRIQPTQGADYASVNPRTTQPPDVGGSLKVSSFNVLNYFTTIDTGAFICGPAGNQECRGADDANELSRQRAKIVAAMSAIDADIFGLTEIENNPADVPTADLVSGLNDVFGAGTYDYIATGAIGGDAIRVALIYKPASVTPVGSYAVLDSTVDPRFVDTKNRPTLAQTFMENSTGGVFTVAINHLKSKGSDCNDLSDPDTGDGAGNCNLTRTAAAQALVDWLASDPTGSGDSDFLIIGDLNSYDKEDPIDAIKAGPDDVAGTSDDYTDLAFQYQGEDAYSYVFDGQTGYLDYSLASASLASQITGAADWHINADEPDLIDYDTTFKQPAQDAIYAPDAYRSSDHDPVITGLDVCDEIAPTFGNVSVTPNVLWPANHKYVDITATVTASDNFDPNPTITLVSITSNEPDNGLGDGDTSNDIVIVDDFHFKLRAERSGGGTGRIYTITYKVTDACGNSATTIVTVNVPHSKPK